MVVVEHRSGAEGEAISGEVDQTYATSPFLLDLGVNRILGTTGCCIDFDSFAFDIPAGLQLTQVNLLFRVTDDSDIDSGSFDRISIDAGQNQLSLGWLPEFFDFAVISSPLNGVYRRARRFRSLSERAAPLIAAVAGSCSLHGRSQPPSSRCRGPAAKR